MWFESAININQRTEPNYGPQLFQYSPDFLNKKRVNSYILNKLTVVDTDNESGRLYQGFPNAEVYFINKDYQRKNRQKVFYTLPLEFDCCSDCTEEFRNRIHWSQQSFQEIGGRASLAICQ